MKKEMVSVRRYRLKEMETGSNYLVQSLEALNCPICGEVMAMRARSDFLRR
ncbi:MAG: hypothetical protein LBL13_04990 [Bacteroidales bacterium]|nr:hypothetical protein [Bacteroidales bacterium]